MPYKEGYGTVSGKPFEIRWPGVNVGTETCKGENK